MKKIIQKEVSYCDSCGKEDIYVRACENCGIEHCYECRKLYGKEYDHAVTVSGSVNGYYCKKCDAELTKTNENELHNAYCHIQSLSDEAVGWGVNFRRRSKEAEAHLEALLKRRRLK